MISGKTIKTFLSIVVVFSLTIGGCSSYNDFSVGEARKLLNGGELDKTIKMVEAVLKKEPDNKEAFLLRGRARERSDEWDQALEDYSEALNRDQDLVEALEARGRL